MSANRAYIHLFFFCFLLSVSSFAQQKTKSQLEKEKKVNLAKIDEAQKILEETETEKKATIGQLKAINRQIQVRTSLIRAITAEIQLLNGEIGERTIIVNALETDLINLKQEYANLIYGAYKANHGFDRLTFLFSAKTFNQLFSTL